MKEDKGIAVMELDDVKIKLDNVGENSDLHTVDGSQLDGMDIDMIDASSEHGVCADRENGLKSNNAVLIENHDSEPIVGMDSGRATTTADENMKSVDGGTDGVSVESTKEVIVTCDATFTSTSCKDNGTADENRESGEGGIDGVSLESTKEVLVTCDAAFTSTSCNNGDPVSCCVTESEEPASCASKNVNVQVVSVDNASTNEDAGLGIEAEDKVHEMHEKPHTSLPMLETGSVVTSVPRQDANEECEGHAAHQQPSLPDGSPVRRVNPGLECEPDLALDKCVDKNGIDGATAQVETNAENQERHDHDANADVCMEDSTIRDSDAGIRNDTNIHEQPSCPDETVINCANQQLECELDTSIVECLDKNNTNGLAQGGSKAEDIQETQGQAANDEQVVAMDAASAGDENVTELHNPVTSAILDNQVMHAESEMDEKLNTSTPIQESEVPDDLIDVSDVMNSYTDPKQDENEECEGFVAYEQRPLLDESLGRGSDQQEKCEPDTSVGECLVKSAMDGVALDGTNMDGIQEMKEATGPIQQIELPVEQLVDEDPDSNSVKPQSKDEKNVRHESIATQQVESPETDVPKQVELPEEEVVDEDPVSDSTYAQRTDEENARHESAPTQQVDLPEIAVPAQQVELPEQQEVNEDPVSFSANPQSKDEENARHESTPPQQVELPETAVPTQQIELPEEQEVNEDPISDSANPQSMDGENGRHESTPTQQVELLATDVPTQQVELPEDQEVDEDPVYPQSMDEENAGHESTPTLQVELPATNVPTQQVELPEDQKVDEDPVCPQGMDEENAYESTPSQQVDLPATDVPTQQVELPEDQKVDENPVYPQSMDEENVRHESTSTRQVELPATDVPTQQVELPENQKVDEDPVYFQSMDEENARHESTSTQQVELPETAVPTQQVELPGDQEVDEDPVSDSANQSMDEENAGHESTPIQQVELPETAVLTQQVDLPEDQKVNEVPVCPQSMDEENARHDSTPTQQVELPQSAVPTQQVELPEDQAVDEDLVSDSANPQSMDEENAEHESTVTPQDELPETAVPTQQVELPEDQEVDEDPVSDSANPQSKDEKNARLESIPVPQVESAETAGPTQPVELLDEREIDEDPVSDSANPQSKDEKNAGCGSTPTQAVESPEAAVSTEQVELPEEQEVNEDPVSDSAKLRSKDEKHSRRGSVKYGSFVSDRRVTYQVPPEDETGFSVFDLVWGKVKSHPWWPGQIFHPSDSSEKAMKYYKKDCYLVAYFGDRSFAWNDASVLKPFMKHFSQEEKQSSTESFQNAVKCALAEVSRRVELGLACSCISEAAYEKIKYQLVENGGIREESSKREGIDRSTGPDTLHSAKLVEYVRALAISPTSGADRLDVVIAKAQLLAFNRLKGCDALAEFQYYDGLAEFDTNSSLSREKGMLGESELGDSAARDDEKTRLKGTRKRKHNLKDIVYQRRKEKSLTELMGETIYYLDGEFDSHEEDDIGLTSPTPGSKRKGSSYVAGDFTTQPSTKTISFAKVSHTASSTPPQSFKVGECIRRVASQLTGSPSILKCASDGSDSKVIGDDVDEVIDAPDDSVTESTITPQKQPSPEEMISQLHLSARDPMKGYSFLGDIISFFYEFRNAAVSAQRQKMRKGPGRKRKASVPAVGSPEAFEFDDRNDSYWTDMVVQNNSEAKPARRGRKRKENHIVAVDSEKPPQTKRRKYTRKQYFHGNHAPAAEIPARDEKQDLLPTELMLNFGDVGSIPSEVNLNKMFRRFGPLKESETEINAQSSRARVVFKKRSDAEVAYSSATMFNVFGSTLVNYQLNYTPSISLGTSPLALSDTVEHAT